LLSRVHVELLAEVRRVGVGSEFYQRLHDGRLQARRRAPGEEVRVMLIVDRQLARQARSIDADDLLQVAHRHRGELLEQLGRAWVALHADVGVAWPGLLLLRALGLGVPLVEGFLIRSVFAATLPELRAVRLHELRLTRRRGSAADQ